MVTGWDPAKVELRNKPWSVMGGSEDTDGSRREKSKILTGEERKNLANRECKYMA